MPRGGARTGAGRKPKPVAIHLAQSTYRPDRHGPRPPNLVWPAPSTCWAPSVEDRAGLDQAGTAVLNLVLADFDPTVPEGLQLLEAARAADVLARLRAAPDPDLRQVRLWSAFFTSTMRMLGLAPAS